MTGRRHRPVAVAEEGDQQSATGVLEQRSWIRSSARRPDSGLSNEFEPAGRDELGIRRVFGGGR
jgi:hypothetical protein